MCPTAILMLPMRLPWLVNSSQCKVNFSLALSVNPMRYPHQQVNILMAKYSRFTELREAE